MDASDAFAAVVSTVCTRPPPASTPMCALYPKCQFFPFLDWRALGSRAWSLSFVGLGTLVGKAERHLEQIHPEHRLCAAHVPAARPRMVAGLHQGAPPVPRHDRVHPLEELLRLVFLLCPCDSRSPKLVWLPMSVSRSFRD